MARRTAIGASSRTIASGPAALCNATVPYLGEISPSQAAAWRKSIDVFDEDAGQSRTLALPRIFFMRVAKPAPWTPISSALQPPPVPNRNHTPLT